jgi:predicted GIY-YIG superfamily endonuclease
VCAEIQRSWAEPICKICGITNRLLLFAHACGASRDGLPLDSAAGMPHPRRFVYIIKSIATPEEYYVGITSDVGLRLQAHNEGLSRYTCRHRPWRTLVVIEFDEEEPAVSFERYLKTGSGREFARRHCRQTVAANRAASHQPIAINQKTDSNK